MIKVLKTGHYALIETKGHTKILTLDGKRVFAWVMARGIGEILVTSHNPHRVDHVLSLGNYRLYSVKDELDYSDQFHLELSVGNKQWQGYLLPTGLPTDMKKRNRIIPTGELITK